MEERQEVCPHCNADMRSSEIPQESLLKGGYGPWEEGDPPRYFYRSIMVEIRGVYDGGLFFQCPDCGGRWHRWSVGSDLHTKAQPYVEGLI